MSFSRFQAWLKPCLGSLEQGTGQQCLWTLWRARIQRLNRTPLFTNRTPLDTRRIRDPEHSFFAGVHFRSDGDQGLAIGEQIAIQYLKSKLQEYALKSALNSFTLEKFDGTIIDITA